MSQFEAIQLARKYNLEAEVRQALRIAKQS